MCNRFEDKSLQTIVDADKQIHITQKNILYKYQNINRTEIKTDPSYAPENNYGSDIVYWRQKSE